MVHTSWFKLDVLKEQILAGRYVSQRWLCLLFCLCYSKISDDIGLQWRNILSLGRRHVRRAGGRNPSFNSTNLASLHWRKSLTVFRPDKSSISGQQHICIVGRGNASTRSCTYSNTPEQTDKNIWIYMGTRTQDGLSALNELFNNLGWAYPFPGRSIKRRYGRFIEDVVLLTQKNVIDLNFPYFLPLQQKTTSSPSLLSLTQNTREMQEIGGDSKYACKRQKSYRKTQFSSYSGNTSSICIRQASSKLLLVPYT